MKYFKNIVSSSVLAISLLFAASSANALVIKHDIIGDFYGKIGSIEVEIKQSALNTGVLDTSFGDDIALVNINLSDLYSFADVFDIFFFEVAIDTDNIFAGIEFFEFDGDDVGFGPLTWSYQMVFDAGTGFGFLDVFDLDGNLVDFDSITLGAAQVSAPATVALLTLAMGAVFMRRKRML
ncbi:PEP-CTERM sorting domain-containing protein [Glaciecola sp. SC05]|uniref:PEP-CTERM sorting domain-containing protein n=1 Tax=Glaciecola sp. SC05 TaxID=1987355 RepID=UPI003528533B